jgi:hypothetical protein
MEGGWNKAFGRLILFARDAMPSERVMQRVALAGISGIRSWWNTHSLFSRLLRLLLELSAAGESRWIIGSLECGIRASNF